MIEIRRAKLADVERLVEITVSLKVMLMPELLSAGQPMIGPAK